jgi:signal transduction histidine kinase/CheY-like chemotaxis protein
MIPRDIACCEVSVNLPAFPTRNTSTSDYSKNVFVVDDLTKHPKLNNRPYVTGFPNARSYVGVPITTPAGTNIGAYCILDDRIRHGITQPELVFMRDMSQTVMSHLETVRALSERSQRNQMMSGLGSFIRKASNPKPEFRSTGTGTMPLADDDNTDAVIRDHLPDALVDSSTPARLSSQSTREEYFDDAATSQQGQESTAIVPSVNSAEPPLSADLWKHVNQDRQDRVKGVVLSKSTGGSSKSGTVRPLLATKDSDIAFRTAYQRAAETLCRSLKIDGVAFLDASVGVFGGLTEASEASSIHDSEDSASTQFSADAQEQGLQAKHKKVCSVLGCAQTLRSDENAPKLPAKKITESLLRSLLRRYPTGNIWLYSEDGTLYSEDGSSTDETSTRLKPPPNTRTQSRKERRDDSKILQSAFPGARCIAIHGIYDHARKRWTVGSLLWSYDPFRILSRETEMHFVATFCDITVAETKRLETIGSDRAKSDFISSISHELRSPLHGILGSAEMLGDRRLDSTGVKLVEQIDSCGRTLLEIIDHLLDFAGLRQTKRRGRRAAKNAKTGQTPSSTANSPGASVDLTTTRTDATLDTLTEEAVSSAAYSFYHDVSFADRSNVPVILDIDHIPAASWHSALPAGGWKRVCLNLVTNALKYTPAGFVRVELRQRPRPGFRRRFDAVLTVSDSGIGMSREFQKRHLFQDFAQENPMSNGLGLGMNMVSRILTSFGGSIKVNSATDGTGTRVTVTVPLDFNDAAGGIAENSRKIDEPAPAYAGVVAGVVVETVAAASTSREGVLQTTASKMAIYSIEKKCNFLGVQTRHCLQKDSFSTDLRIVPAAVAESCFQSMREELRANAQRVFAPMLIICNNDPIAHDARDRWIGDPLSGAVAVEYISLPCPLKQLARAIESLLQSHKGLAAAPVPCVDASDATSCENSERIKLPHSQIDLEPSAVGNGDIPPIAMAPAAVLDVNTEQIPHEDITITHKGLTDKSATHDMNLSVQENPLPSVQLPLRETRGSPVAVRPHSTRCDSMLQVARVGDYEHSQASAVDTPLPPAVKRAANNPVLLIVDDNAINLQLLTMFAKKHKYTYITADDGDAAVKAFQSAHEASSLSPSSENCVPTVVLMDINMPRMDGYESTQLIRKYEKKHNMAPATIFAVTALQSEAARVEAFGSGFDKFVSKPVKLKQLAKMIQEG